MQVETLEDKDLKMSTSLILPFSEYVFFKNPAPELEGE